MKKVFLILLLFVFVQGLKAQIKIKGFIETGYLNARSSLNIVDTYPLDGFQVQYKSGNAFYCDIIADFSIKKFHIEQRLFNMFSYVDGRTFKAMEILYRSRIYYAWEFIQIGYEHMCLHPIINQHNKIDVITRRRGHDKIFIKFTFEN